LLFRPVGKMQCRAVDGAGLLYCLCAVLARLLVCRQGEGDFAARRDGG
jgi:hypothetical protein